MPSKYWIKLYHEILDDPKMGLLNDRLYRRTIEMFLMAGDNEKEGTLPPIEHMAWRLRVSPEELETDLIELQRVGIVSAKGGDLYVTNFSKRQEPIPDVERKQRQRERDKKNKYYGHEPVTKRDGDTDTELTENAANAAANAPTNLEGWIEILKKSNNKQAVLLFMIKTIYPNLVDYPSYQYVGKVAKELGGAGRLAGLLWECAPKNPKGDILSYIKQFSKGQIANKNGSGQSKRKEPEMTPEQIYEELQKGNQI